MLKVGTDLYRQLLVQARRLPDEHAASFYRDQIKDTFRGAQQAESSSGAVKRVQKANKLLRQLQAANDGYLHALTRVLNQSYGRTGRGKHASLRPFLPPQTDKPPTTFTPLLRTLLGSSIAHTTRSPTPAQLTTPPTIPPRGIPGSEAARLLGPLTLQRERAVRGRYWREQVGKLRAPIAVAIAADGDEDVRETLRAAGIGRLGSDLGQGKLSVLEELSRVPEEDQPRLPRRLQQQSQLAPPPDSPPAPATTARLKLDRGKGKPQRKDSTIQPPQIRSTKWHNPKILTARLLRRRYAKMLHDGPILEIASALTGKDDAGRGQVRMSVRRSEWAKDGARRLSALSPEDAAWLAADALEQAKRGKQRSKPRPPKAGKEQAQDSDEGRES